MVQPATGDDEDPICRAAVPRERQGYTYGRNIVFTVTWLSSPGRPRRGLAEIACGLQSVILSREAHMALAQSPSPIPNSDSGIVNARARPKNVAVSGIDHHIVPVVG